MYRILIAEDDLYLRTLFAKAFKSTQFEVLQAADGDEVLYHLNKQLPHVLILDVGLPGPNGLDILKYVRRHEKMTRHEGSSDFKVNVILVTGNQAAKNSPEAVLADAFLLKPVSIRELVAVADKFRMQSRIAQVTV